MRNSLDRIDLQILKDLQHNGRTSNVTLAKNAGISAPPCLRRVRALEKSGIIRGYHAVLDSRILGFQVTIFAQVGLSSQSEADIRAFSTKILEWPLVRESHLIAGEADFFLKIVARSWEEYQNFYATKLITFPTVAHIRSKLVIRTEKQQPGLPLDLLKPKI